MLESSRNRKEGKIENMNKKDPLNASYEYFTTFTKDTYEGPKVDGCLLHNLPKEVFCLSCFSSLNCIECMRCAHSKINIRHVVPKLMQWLGKQWDIVNSQHKQIQAQWRICALNINYCIDILTEIKKQIQSNALNFNPFTTLTAQICELFHQKKPQTILSAFKNIQQQYNPFDKQTKTKSTFARDQYMDRAKEANAKTKKFSQKALCFSQILAELMSQKLKEQKSKLKKLSTSYTIRLKDLLTSNTAQVKQILIQQPQQSTIQSLKQCHNLKSIQIGNRNGSITIQQWKFIFTTMETFQYLTELKLLLKQKDLLYLTELLKAHPNSIRQVQKLTITINDERNVKGNEIADFCNCFQLRYLVLNVARNDMGKNQLLTLIKRLRVHTSMSQLPLLLFNINANKNNVQSHEQNEIQAQFYQKSKGIKEKSIVL